MQWVCRIQLGPLVVITIMIKVARPQLINYLINYN